MTQNPEIPQQALVVASPTTLAVDQDHQLRAFASQVMRVDLTEEYGYKELAIDVHDPQPVANQPNVYDLFVQGFGESDDGCFEAVEWNIRLGFDATGKVVQRDPAE
jgi:hypothetical protein